MGKHALNYFNPNEKFTIDDAIELYGQEKQLACVIEEMVELTQVICTILRGSPVYSWRKELVEEFGDVIVVLEMLARMYDIERDDIEPIVRRKVQRLAERMKAHGQIR